MNELIKGKKCSKICKENGFIIGSVPDGRYGRVNTYPVDVLKGVIRE